jgi:hypothetical protein
MTTRNDNYLDRILRLGQGKADTQGTNTKAFVDPNNEYPRKENNNQSSINQGARGGGVHQLSIGGSVADVSLDLEPSVETYYGKADIRETASGHVIELNDTPAGERVLIKHKTGAGIELRPDGTVLVVSTKNKVEVCHGSNEVIVEGEANLTYKGNLNLNVTGDFNVNCRDYNVHARGSKTEQIDNNSSTNIFGNYGNSVSGTFVQSIAGNTTNVTLGTQTLVTKGDLVVVTEGSQEIVSKGPSIFTSEEQINLSSPDINIVATDIAVAGNRGTIGGGTTVHYGSSFHGNLKGTADHATTADILGGGGGISIFNSVGTLLFDGSGGGSGSGSITHTATANPTEGMTNSYLTVGDRGIRKVHIDIDDYLKNQLLTRKYSKEEVRAKMRDKNNRDFSEWTAYQIASGVLNANYANNVPSSYGSIVLTNQPQERRGLNTMGQVEQLAIVQKYKSPQLKLKFNIAPEARFKSNMSGTINQNTLINHDTSIGKFVGFDDHGEFNKLPNADKQQIAKNYFVISELMKLVSNSNLHPTELENNSLIVVEGYYATEKYGIGSLEKRQTEVLTPNSTLDMRSKGRAVVFELRDQKGKVDHEATFELAKIWSDAGTFDKLILDYDTYDPSGELNTQIIIEVPDIKSYNGIKFARNVQTVFNNNVQSNDALVEIQL